MIFTQRNNEFREELDNLLIIREHLKKNQFRALSDQNPQGGRPKEDGSCRDISNWLDKNELDVKQPHPEGSHEITKTGILETAEKIYDVYQDCEYGIWTSVLEGLGIPNRTWYYWIEKYGWELKYPKEDKNDTSAELQNLEVESAIVEDTFLGGLA